MPAPPVLRLAAAAAGTHLHPQRDVVDQLLEGAAVEVGVGDRAVLEQLDRDHLRLRQPLARLGDVVAERLERRRQARDGGKSAQERTCFVWLKMISEQQQALAVVAAGHSTLNGVSATEKASSSQSDSSTPKFCAMR